MVYRQSAFSAVAAAMPFGAAADGTLPPLLIKEPFIFLGTATGLGQRLHMVRFPNAIAAPVLANSQPRKFLDRLSCSAAIANSRAILHLPIVHPMDTSLDQVPADQPEGMACSP
jgi:hypothetical protein